MWIGMLGIGTPLAVGFDGENVRIECKDELLKKSITDMYKNATEKFKDRKDFDFAEYVGTSSMYAAGDLSEWNEKTFELASKFLKIT